MGEYRNYHVHSNRLVSLAVAVGDRFDDAYGVFVLPSFLVCTTR